MPLSLHISGKNDSRIKKAVAELLPAVQTSCDLCVDTEKNARAAGLEFS